jgi:cytochrome bd-type quinol oxidase subunit 2
MKKLALIVFFAAAGLTWLAVRSDDAIRKRRFAIAAAVGWAIVVVGFLV